MSGNFEWHTDDEWDQFGQDDDSAESPRRSLRNWLIIGALSCRHCHWLFRRATHNATH